MAIAWIEFFYLKKIRDMDETQWEIWLIDLIHLLV